MDIKQTYREEKNLDVYTDRYIEEQGSFTNEYVKWLESKLSTNKGVRFYLVSFQGEGTGSIWFGYNGFPSSLWIKNHIIKKFPQVKKPAIMHIQELNENDYKSFNCDNEYLM